MERSHKKTLDTRQCADRSKPSENVAGRKDHASLAYDEYLWLLQRRNKLLKKLKAKDEQQVELEKREQGFSVYINGANREITNIPMSRRTKTADEHSSSRHLVCGELQVDNATEETRAKTAPTKLTRKEWKPTGIRIKTEAGEKIDVKAPGNITGIYSEDFDVMDESESDEDASSDENSDSDSKVEQLSLSFNDVRKLRRSLEMDSSIRESIQTVIEDTSSVQSDEDCHDHDQTHNAKGQEVMDIQDLEGSDDEIEEELEIGNVSLDMTDSKAVESIPCLKSSYVISENLGERKETTENTKLLVSDKNKGNGDTIVLTFSNNKSQKRQLSATRRKPELIPQTLIRPERDRQKKNIDTSRRMQTGSNIKDDSTKEKPCAENSSMRNFKSGGFQTTRPLSATQRKKVQSSSLLSSKDVLEAVALENVEVEKFKETHRSCHTAPDSSPTKVIPSHSNRPSSVPTSGSITDDTLELVTKKVRNMNASQQKQLLELLSKLDPVNSQNIPSSSPKVKRSMAFVSPETSPRQPLSPETTMPSNKDSPSEENNSLEVNFEILSNWGHSELVGLTEIQFFDDSGSLIDIPKHHIQLANGNMGEASLENLVNGKTKTTNERYMWKSRFTQGSPIELLFHVPCQWNDDGDHNVSRIKVWNYNKKMKDLNVGVKDMRIFIGGELIWNGIVDKGCGNQIYDYAEVMHVKTKQEPKRVEDIKSSVSDPVIRSETVTLRRSEDGYPFPDRPTVEAVEPAPIEIHYSGPESIVHTIELSTSPDEDVHHYPMFAEQELTKATNIELPSKPQWLEEIKEKRSASFPPGQQLHCQHGANWLNDESDQKKDSEIFVAEDLSLLDQPKTRSRPTSGRRSSRKQTPENSSRRTTPRAESGRRFADGADQHVSSQLQQQLTKLHIGDRGVDESLVDQEKLLEESLNSLSQFRKCHQGRITPSHTMEIDQQGDALDGLLAPVRLTSSEHLTEDPSTGDDFIIPELPKGQRLVINILSTWGDQYYVGLNGIEIFSDSGKPVQISQIAADPPDINILPEYNKDPRVASNLIDGVYFTRDDLHLWMAPFTPGRNHFIYIDFRDVSTLAMVRIWNYNKSRIHSFRGAKDIEIFLDDNLIFQGEVARASGELGSSETFGDTILFTMNEAILEAMAANDQTYEPDLDEDEDYLQTSNNFKRPVTSDKGVGTEPLERPFTCPKERKKPTLESTYPNKIVQEKGVDVTEIDGNVSPRKYFGQELNLNFLSTWGDMYYLGLTGLELVGADGQVIDLTIDMLQACPKDLNDLPEYGEDDRTLDKLIDGENVTMEDEHMWLIPFTPGGNHLLTITLKEPKEITGLRLWNYNKSLEGTYRGAKSVLVKLDGKIISNENGILLRKGPGNCHFDFVQEISFLRPPKKPRKAQNTEPMDKTGDEYELTVKPCGFVFQFQLFGSWGDPYYLGLNGLQFFDEDGGMIKLNQKNVTAYPDSVNVLQGVQDDVRTPEKLIDGINDTDDGRHMWLAPIFPGLTNLLYVVFDEPVRISMIKLWNYCKTPIRGVRQFSILVDDLLVFNGILPQVPTVTRGILPNMDLPVPHSTILFTDDELTRKREKQFVINAGGYFENQEVCLVNDKTDVPQKKQKTEKIDQALRPKTSVTNLGRTRR